MKRTSDVNNARLTWEESGSGVPVVFVHGVICDRRMWRAQEAAVAPRYRFVALDLRHHGESDKVGAYRLAQHAEDLKGLLLELGAPRTVLVGHSFGASVVVSLLLQSPDHLAGRLKGDPPVIYINLIIGNTQGPPFRSPLAGVVRQTPCPGPPSRVALLRAARNGPRSHDRRKR